MRSACGSTPWQAHPEDLMASGEWAGAFPRIVVAVAVAVAIVRHWVILFLDQDFIRVPPSLQSTGVGPTPLQC
ncbi:MAG: hypothetical protein ACRDHP_20990, partial [Ktedonobacterales bacterium]